VSSPTGGALPSRPVIDLVCEVLLDWGVDRVFSCPGSTEVAFLDALLRYPELELVLTTHEAVAVAMADGWARESGKPGVVWLHANVGLVNGLANLYCAEMAGSPVVVINGVKSRAVQNRAGFTSATHTLDFTRQTVKWQWDSRRAEDVPADLTQALARAVTSPVGPTYLAIAEDLLERSIEREAPPAGRHTVGGRTRPDPEAVSVAASALAEARRPVIVAGAAVADRGATDTLVAVAELVGAAVFAEERWTVRRDTFPSTHPSYVGCYSSDHPLAADADVVLVAGARTFTSFIERARPPFAPAATVVHLHPDPAEIAKAGPVDVALVGDARLGLDDLLLALGSLVEQPRPPVPTGVSARPHPTSTASRGGAGALVATTVFDVLDVVLPDDVLVVGDPVTATGSMISRLVEPRGRPFHLSGTGALGWGMGAPLGMAMARPGRRIVSVVGDGVVQFGMPALWSAARLGAPITYVVLNNQTYGAVKAALLRNEGTSVDHQQFLGTDISGVDLATVAAGFGLASERVHDVEGLEKALHRALELAGPMLVEVMTDRTDVGPIAR
jgi:benzoylformate decarboxylase